MTVLLLSLTNFVVPGVTAAQSVEESASSVPLGFVVLSIIIAPVIVFALAAMFSHPRQFRVPGLFLGSVVLLIGSMVAGFFIIGSLLKFVIP
ncbi:MAG: hypothetical protein HYX81_00520 [Chloroflexi bacterium]|nr:hypothetical protein [Chloroflexota bacterium]